MVEWFPARRSDASFLGVGSHVPVQSIRFLGRTWGTTTPLAIQANPTCEVLRFSSSLASRSPALVRPSHESLASSK